MPAVRNEVELDLRPRLLEPPRGDGRGAAVVPSLDDDAGDAAQLLGALEQLAFLEPAVPRHIMILDPRDRDLHFWRSKMLDCLGTREQSDDVAFPFAPR